MVAILNLTILHSQFLQYANLIASLVSTITKRSKGKKNQTVLNYKDLEK